MFIDILKFLSPYSGKLEILPILFFTIIILAFSFTWYHLRKNANEKSWDKNWQRNQLDVEQGSISELSQSVATKSENVADVMPGIILIIGLLGTFIGLGLALDKASTILSSADMENMDNSMGQLMGMMEGLGTKFKTSTWGLMAFLALKFISANNNYDERRLNWVSSKVKAILDENREKQALQAKQEQKDLLNAIADLTNKLDATQKENRQANETANNALISSMGTLFSELNHLQKNNHQANESLLSNLFNKQMELVGSGHKTLKEANSKAHSTLLSSVSELFDKLIVNQKEINKHNANLLNKISQEQIELFNQQHQELTATTNSMSSSLADNFDRSIGHLLKQQLDHTSTNQQCLVEMADKICESIQIQQERTIEAVDKNSKFLDKTAQESAKTRDAMDRFVNESLTTIDSLKESAGGMSKAAEDIGSSASKLQIVIDTLSDEMNSLMTKMKEDLGDTINNMNDSFVVNMEKMTRDLNDTISDMSENFKANMTEMSVGLGNATKDISHAVDSLSKSVDTTMSDVSTTINKSMELQKNAQIKFVETSNNLNEQIIVMTNLVEKLSGDITSGLKAVSDSNRRMVSLDNRYNTSADQIDSLVKSISATVEHSQSLRPLLSGISEQMKYITNNQSVLNGLNKISDNIDKLESLFKTMLAEQQKQTDIQSKMNLNRKNEVA